MTVNVPKPNHKSAYQVSSIPQSGPSNPFKVDAGKTPPAKCFTFSLTHWKQIEKFNIGSSPSSWFVSLLERLSSLGCEKIEDIVANRASSKARALRFHPIEWDAKGIPISKADFAKESWLGKDFFNNKNDLCQIQVSTGKGRIIGFFDESYVFQIVLLDIDHNAQPSKDRNYKVVSNRAGDSEYNHLLRALSHHHIKCNKRQCDIISSIRGLLDLRDLCDQDAASKVSLLLYLEEKCCDKMICKADSDEGFDIEALVDLALDQIT